MDDNWVCSACGAENAGKETECAVCFAARNPAPTDPLPAAADPVPTPGPEAPLRATPDPVAVPAPEGAAQSWLRALRRLFGRG